MQGTILIYNRENGTGIISDDENNRFDFNKSNWRSDKKPKINSKVDFEINVNDMDEKSAVNVFPVFVSGSLFIPISLLFLGILSLLLSLSGGTETKADGVQSLATTSFSFAVLPIVIGMYLLKNGYLRGKNCVISAILFGIVSLLSLTYSVLTS